MDELLDLLDRQERTMSDRIQNTPSDTWLLQTAVDNAISNSSIYADVLHTHFKALTKAQKQRLMIICGHIQRHCSVFSSSSDRNNNNNN